MSATQARLEFAPPPTPGLLRSLGLAILAHGVLLAVLTVGIAWKRDPVVATVEAELWSSVPQEAAPAPTEAPPPEPPLPTPPQPVAKPVPPPEPTKTQADIVQAKAKAQKEKAEAEREKQEKDKLARAKQEKLDQAKLAKEKAQKNLREKQAKQAAAKEAAAKEAVNAKRLEQDRQANIQRMQKMAGGTGSGPSSATGNAAQTSGPSAGYMGRIVARIKPNIVFTDSVAGNPRAEVEIRVAPTGSILSARITQSSGIKAWDDAVLRAIEKTEILPKDTDGSVPTSMQIGFRPKD